MSISASQSEAIRYKAWFMGSVVTYLPLIYIELIFICFISQVQYIPDAAYSSILPRSVLNESFSATPAVCWAARVA